MDPCFAVERTLGKLAKWLRLLGFDTVYEQDVSADTFENIKKKRILLTRTVHVWNRHASRACILIKSNVVFDQMREVIRACNVLPETLRPFSRCNRCNTVIRPVTKTAVYGKVPDYVWEAHDSFQICVQCEKIYWRGTHAAHSLEIIKQLFDSSLKRKCF